jgi:hypothetical protein
MRASLIPLEASARDVLLRLRRHEERVLGWCGVAASVGISAVGIAGDAPVLVYAGAMVAAVLMALLAPELVLAVFILAGGVKAAPWLAGLPVDLTLVGWLGTVLAIAIHGLRPGLGVPPFPAGTVLAVPLVVLVVVSNFWSLDPASGLTKTVRFELLTMVAFIAPIVLIRSRLALARLMLGLVGFGVLIALTTVEAITPGERAAAGGNVIQAGLYPAIGAIATVGYLALVTRGWTRVVTITPLAILIPAVLAAGSRGALLAGTLALSYVLARLLVISRRKTIAFGVAVATVAAAVSLGPQLAGPAAASYETLLSTESGEALGVRQELYDRGVALALANPLGGVGVAGYGNASLVYESNAYPHNIIVEFASEEGMAAAGLFVLLVVAAWRARGRAPTGIRGPEAIVSGALVVLLVAEAMASFDINGNRLMWFALGLAFAVSRIRTAA